MCLTVCNPVDCSPEDSSVPWILQARIPEWIAIPFSRGSSWSRDKTQVSCIGTWVLYHWATGKPLFRCYWAQKLSFLFFFNVLKIWIRSLRRMILRTLHGEGRLRPKPWSSRGRFSWKTVMARKPTTLSQTLQLVGYVLTQAPPYGESVRSFRRLLLYAEHCWALAVQIWGTRDS